MEVRRHRLKLSLMMAFVALATLEWAWFYWFLSEPLPNSANLGGIVRRSQLLWRALPEVIPGVRWSQSHVGQALKQLSHFANLPERVPLVLGAGLIATAAVSLGLLLLRAFRVRDGMTFAERLPVGFLLGSTGLGVLTLLMGRLGLLAPWPTRLALLVPIAAEQILTRPRFQSFGLRAPGPGPLWLLVIGPFLVVMALGAMLPTIDFDALEYHLQGPKEFFQAGRIGFLPHNVYTSMPFSVEMLHLLGMEVLDDWWRGALVGQLLVMLHAPVAGLFIGLTARRIASPRAGWIAAVVYLASPWTYRLAAIPYVEGPLCSYHAALVWAVVRTVEHDEPKAARSWAVIGLLAGGAMAIKYPALISAVVPFGLLAVMTAVRKRSWSVIVAFGLGTTAAIGPWLAKNIVDTGNPVYPLGYSVFGGRHWSPEREAKWVNVHGPRKATIEAAQLGLLDVAGRSDWQSPLYTALAPLALLRRGSRRAVLALWGYVAYLFATWFLLTHRLDRFWLPLLPALAVLAGVGADWIHSRVWTAILTTILIIGIATNLVYICTTLAGLNQWTDNLDMLRDEVPRILNRPLHRLDTGLPPGAKVLLVGQASVFHMRHAIVYNTVFDSEIMEDLSSGRSPTKVRDALRHRQITHVYVDWFEIERHRKPGGYGFTDFVTPQLFARLVEAGVLTHAEAYGPNQELFEVR